MSRDELIGRFESLPPEARRQVIDFIERLSRIYGQAKPEEADSQEESGQGFIGMWSGREDLADSVGWVRSRRKREWVNPIE